MKLIVVHQYLILAAIGLAVLFGVRSASLFWQRGEPVDALLLAVSIIVALALGAYVREVRKKVVESQSDPRRDE